MPTELGNLLIRVTSVGFDEVLRNLGELEDTLSRIGANSSLGRISQQLDQMSRCLSGMQGDLRRLTVLNEQNASQMSNQGRQAQEAAQQISKLDQALQGIAKTYTLVMTAVSVGRKFKDSIDQISSFNLSVSNMAMNANMARGSLMELGAIAQGLGGSRQGVAALGSRFQSDLMNMRMGRGGGATLDVATTYGLSLRGSGYGGFATTEEMLRNVAVLFERMGNSESAKLQKLDIKRMLGIDDGTFEMLNKGVKEYDEALKRAAIRTKEMADATAYSKKVSEELANIEQEWNDAKLKMLYAMEPLIKRLLKTFKEVAEWVKQNPGIAGTIATIVGSLGALGTAFALLRKIFGGGTGLLSSVGEGGGGIGVSGARGVGGGANLLGSLGVMATTAAGSVVESIELGEISKEIIHCGSELLMIREKLKVLDEIKSVYDKEKISELVTPEEFVDDYESIEDKIEHDKIEFDQQVSMIRIAVEDAINNMNSAGGFIIKSNIQEIEQKAQPITISEIRIEVNSNSANAEDVAVAVRDELYKQINASIDDAMIKGRVL